MLRNGWAVVLGCFADSAKEPLSLFMLCLVSVRMVAMLTNSNDFVCFSKNYHALDRPGIVDVLAHWLSVVARAALPV